MFSKTLFALSALAAVGTASVVPMELRQNTEVCSTVYVANNALVYPVVINQYFDDDTIINIGGITINIEGPTSLITTVTATTTAPTTVTATTTATVTSVATAFILIAEPVAVAKRATTFNYVGGGGSTTDDCSSAQVFTIENGMLMSEGEFVSTSLASGSETFSISNAEGSISTTFSVNAAGHLVWSNSSFTGGLALFAEVNGVNTAIFDATYPAGSQPLNLVYQPASNCNNGALSTSSAANSTSATSTSAAATSSIPTGPITVTSVSVSSTTIGSTTVSSVTSSASAAVSSAFAITIPGAGAKAKRQNTRYIGADGLVTTDETLAINFFLTGVTVTTGQGLVSVNSTSVITPFAGSAFVGDISTSFIVDDSITFSNASFSGGEAAYCTEANILYIVNSGVPDGCTEVALVVADPVVMVSTTGSSAAATSTAAASSGSAPVSSSVSLTSSLPTSSLPTSITSLSTSLPTLLPTSSLSLNTTSGSAGATGIRRSYVY